MAPPTNPADTTVSAGHRWAFAACRQRIQTHPKKYTAGLEMKRPGGACTKLGPAIPSKVSFARRVPTFDDMRGVCTRG